MGSIYPWIKALHVISVIAWMAGMLYLPRLFVYHAGAPVGSQMSETFKVMERRLMRAIMLPAAVATWGFGGTLLALNPALLHENWMMAKLAMVVLMTGIHHAMIGWRKAFAEDRNMRSDCYFRIANEIPTVILIVIVLLVIVRPF